MNSSFKGWDEVGNNLRRLAEENETQKGRAAWLNAGQCLSLRAIANRIANNGVIIADEVGMGKTRIAVAAAYAVKQAGGRVAIVVPPGLGFQWEEELRVGHLDDTPPILRSLWAYLRAWESDDPQQRQPWFNLSVVVLSHVFANWRLGDRASYWRRALLPEVYAQWNKLSENRLPRFYFNNEILNDPWVKHAGESIASSIPLTEDHPGRLFLNALLKDFHWTGSLDGDYGRESTLRRQLERTVGLGLGVFDLVIIDEAHKSRGTYTGLSRLLETVLFTDSNTRRICMTATPVELDVSQWKDPLRRIGLDEKNLDFIQKRLDAYADAVKRLRRCWRGSPEARREFVQAAQDFQKALCSYVLKRDKREDEHVQKFCRVSGLDISQYRQETEIQVDMTAMPKEWKWEKWKMAVCGAESLSVAAGYREDPVAKRLRLTLGNGHGIAAFLDEAKRDGASDAQQEAFDGLNDGGASVDPNFELETRSDRKRLERCAWWQQIIKQAFERNEFALFDHPAIRAAVDAIEKITSRGEKVLVFGRFTQPMRALTDLLNAREMLRRIHSDPPRPWPQRKVHGDRQGTLIDSEWPSVRAAWQQLGDKLKLGVLDEKQLDNDLKAQYHREDREREQFRKSLDKLLRQGLENLRNQPGNRYQMVFDKLHSGGSDDLAVVARALKDLSKGTYREAADFRSSDNLATNFKGLVDSAMAHDNPDADGDGIIDAEEVEDFVAELLKRINEEYGRTQSGFARFMFGETSAPSRRLIQQAFNRPDCFPEVLVAQSMVGREGLNLHKACRTVILLHPEWNPGVVEQQIGRVDRVSSHWCNLLSEAVEQGVTGEKLPRINVFPIVFKGTYDEYNWSVLRRRWDDLRSQLHGIVIPEHAANSDEEGKAILSEIKGAAPSFSPS